MDNDLLKIGLISQSGECIVLLSRYLLSLNVGDRILPKGEIAKKYHLGVGTVQNAFASLERANAVHIDSRGHLGSFIIEMDKNVLWEYSMYGYVRGTMPLPYHSMLTGLATGINKVFNNSMGIMLRMSYIRGSQVRIQNMCEGLDDFTVCSLYAAKKEIKKEKNIYIFKKFSLNTYIGQSVILLRKGVSLKDGITVGIDQSSVDQANLTKEFFKDKNVHYETVQYNNFHYLLKKKKIDACIWSSEDIRDFDGEVLPLPDRMQSTIDDVGRAVIVVSKSSNEKMQCVKELFDVPLIEKIQRDVIDQKVIPNY